LGNTGAIHQFGAVVDRVGAVDLSGIHWAIVGGESGPGSRPIAQEWVDEIRKQCRKYETAFFFKQWGGTNKKAAGRTYRGRTWDEYPERPPI
jgi:protein gp37